MTQWRKSSRSNSSGGACVEIASLEAAGAARAAGAVGVRDSKAPSAGHLTLSATAFADLIARVKRADLDL